jgi:hypothetical protein
MVASAIKRFSLGRENQHEFFQQEAETKKILCFACKKVKTKNKKLLKTFKNNVLLLVNTKQFQR